MKFDPKIHHRRSIRLQGYDYSQAGAYYVTIVAWRREHVFGEVVNAEMQLNKFGQIVNQAWYDLPKHYPHVELDTFCIMPNHVHAIIVLNDNPAIKRHPLSEVVRAFKSFSARRINSLRNTQGIPVWQRNYYEHIIRNHEDYLSKSNYILDNPLNWENDDENKR
ncbi:MAG: transposase [Anaerolineales bacterium]|nr:transposase [Anaerolineales bacterium]